MRSKVLAALATVAAMFIASCATAGPPAITVFADGTAIELAPVNYCDIRVVRCETNAGAKGTLTIRTGQPVQISVPPEVAKSPWLVYTQSITSDGETLPVEQHYFGPGKAFAYTARPGEPRERLLVIEVHQAGAAFADDGSPIARGLWSLELRPRTS